MTLDLKVKAKSLPLILSGDDVRSVLSGSKIQLAKPVKAKGWDPGSYQYSRLMHNGKGDLQGFFANPDDDLGWLGVPCPYSIGDKFWVRETWGIVHPVLTEGRASKEHPTAGIPGPPSVKYRVVWRADGSLPNSYYTQEYPYRSLSGENENLEKSSWIPSSQMPREASRITLQLTSIEIQRAHSVSGEASKQDNSWVWVLGLNKDNSQK